MTPPKISDGAFNIFLVCFESFLLLRETINDCGIHMEYLEKIHRGKIPTTLIGTLRWKINGVRDNQSYHNCAMDPLCFLSEAGRTDIKFVLLVDFPSTHDMLALIWRG